MKKYIILAIIILLSGCGVTTSSDSDSSSKSVSTTSPYAYLNGFYADASNIKIQRINRTVLKNDFERLYHEECFYYPSDERRWKVDIIFTGGIADLSQYSWNPTSNAWELSYEDAFEITVDATTGKISQKIWKAANDTYSKVYTYTYPGYIGEGYPITVNQQQVYYNEIDNTPISTDNVTTIREYSADFKSVTENVYFNGSFDYKYIYTVN